MKFKYILIFSILLAVFVAGCVEESRADSGRFTIEYPNPLDEMTGGMRVIHDNVNNVTIYMYFGYHETSISAIPDWQMKEPANNTKV